MGTAVSRGTSDAVDLSPASIASDRIQDVGASSAEARGGAKQAEGLGWLVRFMRGFSVRSGDIHIRFGEPLSIDHLEPDAAKDELLVMRLTEELRAEIQVLVDQGLRDRESVWA